MMMIITMMAAIVGTSVLASA